VVPVLPPFLCEAVCMRTGTLVGYGIRIVDALAPWVVSLSYGRPTTM
jgi:hypothetical protein